MTKMRALVASDDSALAIQLRDKLTRLGHECPLSHLAPLDEAASDLAALSGTAGASAAPTGSAPELVFVVLTPDVERGIATLRALRRVTQTNLFAVGPVTDPKLVLRVLREGAQEYLDQADLADELTAALDRLKAASAGRQQAGRVIGILPASGGCGCSTLAASLAAAFAKLAGGCVLIDVNAEFGDLATLLDLKPTYTLFDLCRSGSRLDRSLLEGALVSHNSGVKLLAAGVQLADADQATADGVRRILSLSTELAPFVVADLPHSLRPEVLETLSGADTILLVLRLDFTSLRNARRLLEHLPPSDSTERLQIVVNRYGQPGELSASDAEAALGAKITHFVHDDPKSVNRTNNNGIPIVVHAPSAKVSREILGLATSLRSIKR